MLKLHRGEGPFFGFLKRTILAIMRFSFTPPKSVKPVFRFFYHAHYAVSFGFRQFLNVVYRGPLFKARCETVGRNLSIYSMPAIVGPVQLFIGDDVEIFGHLGVTSGRIFDAPRLVIGDRVDIGHNIQITVNREVVIEEEVNIASGVRILDTDAHPRDTDARAHGLPPPEAEIKAVRICRRAWLGQSCFIMKGVTVGEGAVIGANSVVVTDIPPYSVAMGNPARVVVKDVRQSVASPGSAH
jgi:acetyltransferase-like isoleucine patch superfamily enzyme